MSTTRKLLRFSRTTWPPISACSQSGGGGGSCPATARRGAEGGRCSYLEGNAGEGLADIEGLAMAIELAMVGRIEDSVGTQLAGQQPGRDGLG